MSCKCKCKFDNRKTKSGISINVGLSAKIQENIMFEKKIIFEILLHVLVKMINIQKVLLVIQ